MINISKLVQKSNHNGIRITKNHNHIQNLQVKSLQKQQIH